MQFVIKKLKNYTYKKRDLKNLFKTGECYFLCGLVVKFSPMGTLQAIKL